MHELLTRLPLLHLVGTGEDRIAVIGSIGVQILALQDVLGHEEPERVDDICRVWSLERRDDGQVIRRFYRLDQIPAWARVDPERRIDHRLVRERRIRRSYRLAVAPLETRLELPCYDHFLADEPHAAV